MTVERGREPPKHDPRYYKTTSGVVLATEVSETSELGKKVESISHFENVEPIGRVRAP